MTIAREMFEDEWVVHRLVSGRSRIVTEVDARFSMSAPVTSVAVMGHAGSEAGKQRDVLDQSGLPPVSAEFSEVVGCAVVPQNQLDPRAYYRGISRPQSCSSFSSYVTVPVEQVGRASPALKEPTITDVWRRTANHRRRKSERGAAITGLPATPALETAKPREPKWRLRPCPCTRWDPSSTVAEETSEAVFHRLAKAGEPATDGVDRAIAEADT
jgi:hypothetical protein